MSEAINVLEQEPQSKSEDIAKAFQMGLAIGFGERYDELDRVIDEIKKVITPQQKPFDLTKSEESAERNNKRKNQCDFCKTIYPDAETMNIFFRQGKYSDVNKDSFISIDDEGKYHININPGDPHEFGDICDTKFCPYCGRKLAESEG